MGIVERWLNYLRKSKSSVTVNNYRKAFLRSCEEMKITPEKLVELSKKDPKKLRKLIKDFFLDKIAKQAPLTKNQKLSAIRSFLSFANEDFHLGKIEFDKSHTLQSIFDVEIPTKEKLKEILKKSDKRTRAIIALYAFCGLRPRIIVSLNLSAFVEMSLNEEIKFEKLPTLVVIRKDLPGNKAKVDYFVFLIEEGAKYIIDYLNERRRAREELSKESKVIEFEDANTIDERYNELYRCVKDAFKKAGFNAKPYVLRSYFDIALSEALNQTKREFYMGHRGDLDVRYAMRKKHSMEKIEEFRKEWKEKVEPKLY